MIYMYPSFFLSKDMKRVAVSDVLYCSPLHLKSLMSVMGAIMYFPFSSSPVTQEGVHSLLLPTCFPWHFAIRLVELRAEVSKRPTWRRLMNHEQAPASSGCFYHTMNINIGFDLTLLENNQFAVTQSRGTPNDDFFYMRRHELATRLCVLTYGCVLMQELLKIHPKPHFNDAITEELGILDEDMAISDSEIEYKRYSVERVMFKPPSWLGTGSACFVSSTNTSV